MNNISTELFNVNGKTVVKATYKGKDYYVTSGKDITEIVESIDSGSDYSRISDAIKMVQSDETKSRYGKQSLILTSVPGVDYDYALAVIEEILGKDKEDSMRIMCNIHNSGNDVVLENTYEMCHNYLSIIESHCKQYEHTFYNMSIHDSTDQICVDAVNGLVLNRLILRDFPGDILN